MKLIPIRPDNQLGECEYWKCDIKAWGTSVISGRKLCKPHLNREYMREETKKISPKSKGIK